MTAAISSDPESAPSVEQRLIGGHAGRLGAVVRVTLRELPPEIRGGRQPVALSFGGRSVRRVVWNYTRRLLAA